MDDAAIAFHELSFVPEGDDVVVGRVNTDSYAVLPSDGAALLKKMAGGIPPDRAALWYESAYGEPVDIGEFLETLRELGFVRGGETAGEPAGTPARAPLRRLARAAFSPLAQVGYVAVVAVWL